MPQTMKAHIPWAVLAVRISLDLGGGCEWEAEGGMSHLEYRSGKGKRDAMPSSWSPRVSGARLELFLP